jgi:hypothetical protein
VYPVEGEIGSPVFFPGGHAFRSLPQSFDSLATKLSDGSPRRR